MQSFLKGKERTPLKMFKSEINGIRSSINGIQKSDIFGFFG